MDEAIIAGLKNWTDAQVCFSSINFVEEKEFLIGALI